VAAPRSAAAAVAATERNTLMAAALALPGLALAPAARADTPPDQTTLAFKQLYYRDDQPGQQRMRIESPALYWLVPVKDVAAIEGYAVSESISGASPYFFNTLSGASGLIRENRNAFDIKGTYFMDRAAVALGVASSHENDFSSRALRAEARFSTDDQNTTLSLGAGHIDDTITSTVDPLLHQARHTDALLAGITQVWSPVTIAQLTLTATFSQGYQSDPYKLFDQRPNQRNQYAALARVNHYVAATEGAVHLEYRYYQDDWGIRASNIGADYYQPLGKGWMIHPSARYYTQGAASFYSNTFPPPEFGVNYSADQRLSSFGAISWGLQVSRNLGNDFTFDLSFDDYNQRTGWRAFGSGSPGLESFRARYVTLGLSKKF
jgi:hypothetical protein